MQFGELRAALRAMKGNPSVDVTLGGLTFRLPLQKMRAIEEISAAFPDAKKATETGIDLLGDLLCTVDERTPTVLDI